MEDTRAGAPLQGPESPGASGLLLPVAHVSCTIGDGSSLF